MAVRNVTDAAVVELLGAIPTEPEKLAAYQRQVDAIVERGARYYDPNQWSNPAHVRAAVVQAHADLEAEATHPRCYERCPTWRPTRMRPSRPRSPSAWSCAHPVTGLGTHEVPHAPSHRHRARLDRGHEVSHRALDQGAPLVGVPLVLPQKTT